LVVYKHHAIAIQYTMHTDIFKVNEWIDELT